MMLEAGAGMRYIQVFLGHEGAQTTHVSIGKLCEVPACAKALEGSMDYITMNPVRRGLCDKATDGPWSSARYYLRDSPRQQLVVLPFIHGVPSDSLN